MEAPLKALCVVFEAAADVNPFDDLVIALVRFLELNELAAQAREGPAERFVGAEFSTAPSVTQSFGPGLGRPLRQPPSAESTASTMNTKKIILAPSQERLATPAKPKKAAIKAITRKATAHRNIGCVLRMNRRIRSNRL